MSVSRPLSRALQLSILDGALFSVYWSIVAGSIINSLLLALGGEPMHLAILNGLPLLSSAFGIIAAKIIQTRDIRKPLVLVTEGISRLAWIFVPLVVLFPQDSDISIWFILSIAAVSHIVHSGGAVGWLSWVSDLIPESIRGMYFGVRNAITGLVGMIGITFASIWADRVHRESGYSRDYVVTLLILVGISVLFAAASWVCLYFQPVRRMRDLGNNGWGAIWETLRSPNGSRIAVGGMVFAFATGFTTGLYLPAMLDRYHIPLVGVSAYGWVALALTTLCTPVWGRIADRFGNTTVLRISWCGVFWQPLLFVFTPYSAPHVLGLLPLTIIIDAIAGGIFWPAVGLAQTNLIIAEAPSQKRAGFYAALAALNGLIAFTAVTIGAVTTKAIGSSTVNLGFMLADNIQAPLMGGALLRLLAGAFLFRISEPPRKREPVSERHALSTLWRLLAPR